MHQAIPDWEIKKSRYQKFIPILQLPDQNDRHVLAAAIAGEVDFILTTNIKDFPTKIVDKYDIKIIHPDNFIRLQMSLDPMKSIEIIKCLRERYLNPKINALQFVDSLKKVGLHKSAQHLHELIELI